MVYQNREKEILLGQSMNQAITLMQGSVKDDPLSFKDEMDTYKTLVRTLFNANTELQTEMLTAHKKASSTPTSQTSGNVPCPNCKKPIPSSWSKHFECGWEK